MSELKNTVKISDDQNVGNTSRKRFLWIFALAILALGPVFLLRKHKTPEAEQIKQEVAGDFSAEKSDQQDPPQKEEDSQKKVFGYSENGKPIEGYVFGDGESTLLFHASVHGDEMGTTDLLNVFADEIKNNPNLLASSTRVVIIPIVNPDGYYDRTDKLNSHGVNLNLNFKTKDWKNYGPEGTYAGKEPFSEKESRVLKQVVEEYKPVAMIAFHSEGALVSPESEEDSLALARWYAKETGYTYYTEWDFAGTATRWFEEVYHKPAITVEVTKQFSGDWSINKKALLKLISSDLNSLISG